MNIKYRNLLKRSWIIHEVEMKAFFNLLYLNNFFKSENEDTYSL